MSQTFKQINATNTTYHARSWQTFKLKMKH